MLIGFLWGLDRHPVGLRSSFNAEKSAFDRPSIGLRSAFDRLSIGFRSSDDGRVQRGRIGEVLAPAKPVLALRWQPFFAPAALTGDVQ